MVDFGAKNQTKLTTIKLGQKAMILKIQQTTKKILTRSLVGEIT
jgi:hypothetical protein